MQKAQEEILHCAQDDIVAVCAEKHRVGADAIRPKKAQHIWSFMQKAQEEILHCAQDDIVIVSA